MQSNPLTLHVRLTKHCNADCGYCSSWQESPDRRLSPENLERSIRFILATAPQSLGVVFTHVTAQFIGGEIATVPHAELDNHIAAVKKVCSEYGATCVVGAQSNLIVSPEKAVRLYDQFEGKLGTSIDLTSDKRTIKGDADKYRLIWKSADQYLRKHRSPTGAVFVVEPNAANDALEHLKEAARSRRMITFRPIFQGGIEGMSLNSSAQMKDSMLTLFDAWFLKLPVIAEPFYQMTESRIAVLGNQARVLTTACAFQHDCTRKSINIDPNGDLFICQEMADHGLAPIGNAISGAWNDDAIALYASRSGNLDETCKACPFLKSCQGGCMYEAIAQGQGVHGKSFHCSSWKAIYQRIDDAVAEHGAEHIRAWLHLLATRHENAMADGASRAINDQFLGGMRKCS